MFCDFQYFFQIELKPFSNILFEKAPFKLTRENLDELLIKFSIYNSLVSPANFDWLAFSIFSNNFHLPINPPPYRSIVSRSFPSPKTHDTFSKKTYERYFFPLFPSSIHAADI